MKKIILTTIGAAFLVLLGLTFSTGFLLETAQAQNPEALSSKQHPSITEVAVIGLPHSLKITGENFDFSSPSLSITLGDVGVLALIRASAVEIIVRLPDQLDEGDYLLTVANGDGEGQEDVYDLSIGAVDPVQSIGLLSDQSESAALLGCGCGHITTISCMEYLGCPGQSQPRPWCARVANHCKKAHYINICMENRGELDICLDRSWFLVPAGSLVEFKQTGHCKIEDIQLTACSR